MKSIKDNRKGKRRKGILWDYDRDGSFPCERIKGQDKRYWSRWTRREGKKEIERQI